MSAVSTELQPGAHEVFVENGSTTFRFVRRNVVERGARWMVLDEYVVRLPYSSRLSTTFQKHTPECPGCDPCAKCDVSTCLCRRDGCAVTDDERSETSEDLG